MKKIALFSMTLLAGLLLWPAAASAQDYHPDDVAHEQAVDPNHIFDFVDAGIYSNNMSITAVVEKDGARVSNAIVAAYAADGIRGKDIPDPTADNLVYLMVYGENTVPLVFQVYFNGKIYVADTDEELNYVSNGIVGTKNAPFVLTLKNPVSPGDVNADGTVDIADAVAVADYIIGQQPASFVKPAADVNKDGNITISDATRIVDMVLP